MTAKLTRRSKDGKSWSVRIDMGYETVKDPVTGQLVRKRKQKRLTLRGTKKEVEQQLTSILAAMHKGEYVEPTKMTFGEWLDEWLTTIIADKRPRTRETYRAEVENHIKPKLGDIPLQKLQATHLQRYYNEATTLAGKPLSAATKEKHHIIIHSALEAAVKLGLVARNVAKLVPSKPTKPDTPEDVLQNCWTAEEARRFLASLQDESLQVQAFYTLALETGMRKGELAGLKWTDIDFEAGTVTVARTLLKPGREPVFGPPKNGLPRTIALSKATLRLLKRHRAQQNERKLANREQYRDHGLVFAKDWEDMKRETDCLGDPLQINNIAERQFDRLQEKAGVRRIKFHGLRHTCATLALMAGWQPHEVQRLLGHKRVEITLQIYGHVLPDRKLQMAESMSRLLRG